MRAEHWLFLVCRIAPGSRAKVCARWGIIGPPGGLLAADRSGAVVLVWFLLTVFGVGFSCRNLCSFIVCLCVGGVGSVALVGEERAGLSSVVYL